MLFVAGSLAVLAYTWLGYPLVVGAMGLWRRRVERDSAPRFPRAPLPVTVLLTVRDEETAIARRLDNLLASVIDVPLEVLVASDGSGDRTDAIVEEFARRDSRVRLVVVASGGKSAAQQAALPRARGQLVVLTDAGTMFERDTVANLVRPLADSSVGCTVGTLLLSGRDSAIASSQGMYWRYETWMRQAESAAGLLHTASGQVMAFRKADFCGFAPEFGDDCAVPLLMLRRGLRVVHVPGAVAVDTFPSTVAGELRTRRRMTLRNVSCTFGLWDAGAVMAFPAVTFAIVSHKILRWMTPFFLVSLALSTVALAVPGSPFHVLLMAQLGFYALGVVGYFAERAGRRVPLASPVFSFLLANVGFAAGVIGALRRTRITSYRSGPAQSGNVGE